MSKKKELWPILKRGFVIFFIFLVIGSFVVSLAYSPWSFQRNMPGYRIAKIKNTTYDYQPNTPFYYLYTIMRKNLSETMKGQVDEALLSQYSMAKSLNTLIETGTVYQFAQDNNLIPSQEALRRIIETTTRSYLYKTPDQGLLDFATMQYDFDALEGNNGDLINVVSIPTYAELYSYYEMENYTHAAEFIYLDITNYISEKLSVDEIKGYYDDNYGRYINELTVRELSTTSHALAYSICQDAQSIGWDRTVEKYKGQANYIASQNLKDMHGTSTRYAAAVKLKKGDISKKPVFENREYHIIKLIGYQSYQSLTHDNQKSVMLDFINKKFSDLKTKSANDIKIATDKAENELKSSSDFKKIAALSGFKYLKTDKISPLSLVIVDEQGNRLTFPILENQDLLDFIFTGDVGAVSKTISTEGYIVIARLLKKSTVTNLDYRNLATEFRPYQRYKSIITMQDWFKSLEHRYPHTIYSDDITNLEQILKRE